MRLTKYLRECFVKAVFADIPTPKAPTLAELQTALYEQFDPLVKAVYDNLETRGSLKTQWYHESGRGGNSLICGSFDYNKTECFTAREAAQKAYNDSYHKLSSVAASCTTLKQLQEALPELVKYMVSEDKPTPVNLPAIVGTVDALKALGWKS